MYEMVQNAYGVTMVSCLVPLVAGIYWKRANVPGAVLAVTLGLAGWGTAAWLASDAMLPPVLVGLLASTFGMLVGAAAVGRASAPTYARAPHGGAASAAERAAQRRQPRPPPRT